MDIQLTNFIGDSIQNTFGKPKPTLTEDIYKHTLQIPKKTFSKYVDNKLQPRLDELQRIAEWLKVDPKDLF
jgi:hypothetical protein